VSAPPPGSGRASLADALQSVAWEYNEDEASLSPLVATIRYFESFPWEGTGDGSRDGGELPHAGLVSEG
jgi:hypothetical protein